MIWRVSAPCWSLNPSPTQIFQPLSPRPAVPLDTAQNSFGWLPLVNIHTALSQDFQVLCLHFQASYPVFISSGSTTWSFYFTRNSIPMSMFLACSPSKNISSLWTKPDLFWAVCPVSRAWPATDYSVFVEPLCEWMIKNERTNVSPSKREAKTVIWKASPTGFSRLILGTSYFRGVFLIPGISFLVILPFSPHR